MLDSNKIYREREAHCDMNTSVVRATEPTRTRIKCPICNNLIILRAFHNHKKKHYNKIYAISLLKFFNACELIS